MEPYRIEVPDIELERLRGRLAVARWPERETVRDWSQGVPLDVVRDLCDHWRSVYDWRATEERVNRWPQSVTTVNELPIHLFHLRSSSPSAVPLILTHGWPGSYDRFLAAGSDWGTSVSTSIALQAPEKLLGLHLIPPLVPATPDDGTPLTAVERSALDELDDRSRTASAYSAIQATRPQTIGYSLVDSPVGLSAWILEKIWTWSDHDGDLYELISRDQVLDNTGCTVFPREVPRPSRRLAEQRFTNIVHWGEPARGGHFGAWEQPDQFVDEIRATAAALRL